MLFFQKNEKILENGLFLGLVGKPNTWRKVEELCEERIQVYLLTALHSVSWACWTMNEGI